MLGENPAQSLKLIRLTGPDAFMQAQDIYQILTFLTGILKRACRSRGIEDILGDVLTGQAPPKAKASIQYRVGSVESTATWTPDAAPTGPLGAISVFDAHCVPVYLKDKTDVAFRPFGLELFDKQAASCLALKGLLDTEVDALNKAVPILPTTSPGTRVRSLLDSLSEQTYYRWKKAYGGMPPSQVRELKQLREENGKLKRLVADPDLATDIADGDATVGLLQDGGDLLDGKALLLHGISSGPMGRIMPQLSPSDWSGKTRSPSNVHERTSPS